MKTELFFARLWQEYIRITPQAEAIHRLFLDRNSRIVNDHVAVRTYDIPPLNLENLEPLITGLGYRLADHYRFPEKRLLARSYLGPEPEDPRIFISSLITDSLSRQAKRIIQKYCSQVETQATVSPELFFKGRLWQPPTWDEYRTLLQESEYAAWLSMLGLRANHFTISVNQLEHPGSLQEVNDLLKQAGFRLNRSGGEIKGSAEALLEQSSTLADRMSMTFAGGDRHEIPTCYYEFARRYRDQDGALFQGFVTASADRIFESTDIG